MKTFSVYYFVLLAFFQLTFPHNGSADNHPGFGNQVIRSSIWSVFRNPAGLTGVEGYEAGIFYRRSMFLDELSTKGFVLAVPLIDKTPVAVGVQRFGYHLYHETKLNLALARSFSDKVKSGLSFDYHNYAFGNDYGNFSYITATAGFLLQLSRQVNSGVSFSAPVKLYSFQESESILKTDVAAALSWSPGNHLVLSAGVSKIKDRAHEVKFDVYYKPFLRFDLTAGVSTGLAPFHFGYSFQLLHCRIGMIAGYHFSAGFTPQITFSYKRS
jgi:hypothetical protein